VLHGQEQYSTLMQHMAEEEEAHVEEEAHTEEDELSMDDSEEEEGAP
jgi:hypothetical protein